MGVNLKYAMEDLIRHLEWETKQAQRMAHECSLHASLIREAIQAGHMQGTAAFAYHSKEAAYWSKRARIGLLQLVGDAEPEDELEIFG